MHHILPGIPSSGHSAAFTYDGKVVVFGWEPGGGVLPACQATGSVLSPPIAGSAVQTDDMKSYFFFSVETGELLGKFVLPRDQGADEACTIHNYNVVPLRKRGDEQRYVLVSGNYMSGISVVDFTDPANAEEIAYADPAARSPTASRAATGRPTGTTAASTSPTSRGAAHLAEDKATARTANFRTPFSNPQTAETSLRVEGLVPARTEPPRAAAMRRPPPSVYWR